MSSASFCPIHRMRELLIKQSVSIQLTRTVCPKKQLCVTTSIYEGKSPLQFYLSIHSSFKLLLVYLFVFGLYLSFSSTKSKVHPFVHVSKKIPTSLVSSLTEIFIVYICLVDRSLYLYMLLFTKLYHISSGRKR